MAAPITHVVLAEKVYGTYFSHIKWGEFLIGNLFPDIRYLGHISREESHYFDLDLADIQSTESAFVAGVKLHSLIDLVREEFVVQEGLYDLFHAEQDRGAIPKFLEDIVLHHHISDWNAVATALHTTLPEEEAFGMPDGTLAHWHQSLARYVVHPSDQSRIVHAADLGFPKERIDVLNQKVAELEKAPRATEIAEALYNRIEELLLAWKR